MIIQGVRRLSLVLLAAAAALASVVPAQVPGVTREQMWFAPTAEDWKKPVLITFQRTWDDALAVAEESGKAILICVNMDGEIASEHYAGIRYRMPEIAAIYEPYVCVIASVYRHNPRDHDDEGHRISCPRFGSVTCGEHIAIEPVLYEKYFEGERVAPRHIAIELDKKEVYDVYYAFDTDSVFKTIREGSQNRPPLRPVRGDRSIVERVESRDVADRDAVESAYKLGDENARRSILQAAMAHPDATPVEVLRLAVFGLDLELARMARQALANATSDRAIDLINESLRVPMPAPEREGLIAALVRLGETSPRARTLAVIHRDLATGSDAVDVEGWSKAIAGGATYAAPTDWVGLESKVEAQLQAASARPEDGAAQLELAATSLKLAVDPKTEQILSADPRTASKYSRLMFEDCHRAALEAEKLGVTGWRLHATVALSAYYLGDIEEAYRRAEVAMPEIPPGAEDWSAISTIALFAQARQRAVLRALQKKEEWPGSWLTDVDAAYSVLARHPLGTDRHVAAHYDFLNIVGASGRAAKVLNEGLTRFPESWTLHDCLRSRLLKEQGVDGLEKTYEAMLARDGAAPNLEWFAGYTSIVAAEFHRRRGRDADAAAAYTRAIAHYESSIEANPDNRSSADHYVALALAGSARLAFEGGDYERSLARILDALQRKPEAAATLDGLNISAVTTAQLLRARLRELERDELVAQLQAALDELDPELLLPPEFDRVGPRRGGGNGGRRRR